MINKSLGSLLGGKWSHELVLLFDGLEFTVTDLGGGIDELDLSLMGVESSGWLEKRLSDGDLSLSWSHNGTSEEEEIFVDNTVMWESTNWGDVFDMSIRLGGGVVVDTSNGTSSNSEDLMVDLGSVIVTEDTRSGNSPLDCRWMPGTNTTDLSVTSSRLDWKSRDTVSLDNTLGTLTSGDRDGINHLGILEDFSDGDFVLELGYTPVNLLSDGSSVNLDLHKVSLSLSKLDLLDLSGAENSDDLAVLLDSLEISVDMLVGVSLLFVLLGVVGESLLLGARVVLIESSDDTLRKLLGPDGGESSESSWGLDVTDHTDNNHWWSLNNSGGIDDILLDGLLTFLFVNDSDDVGHTSLVAHEGSKMNWLGLVVLWEMSDVTLGVLSSSLWEECKMALSWMLELSVRHSVINK